MSLAPIIAALAVGLIALVLAIYFARADSARRPSFLIVSLVLLVSAALACGGS
jgi:hypothetical protein